MSVAVTITIVFGYNNNCTLHIRTYMFIQQKILAGREAIHSENKKQILSFTEVEEEEFSILFLPNSQEGAGDIFLAKYVCRARCLKRLSRFNPVAAWAYELYYVYCEEKTSSDKEVLEGL